MNIRDIQPKGKNVVCVFGAWQDITNGEIYTSLKKSKQEEIKEGLFWLQVNLLNENIITMKEIKDMAKALEERELNRWK